MNAQAISRIVTQIINQSTPVNDTVLYQLIHDYTTIPASVIVHYEYETVLEWIDSIPNNDHLYALLDDDRHALLNLIKHRNSHVYSLITNPFRSPRFVIERLVECYNEFVIHYGVQFDIHDQLEIDEDISIEQILAYHSRQLALGAITDGWTKPLSLFTTPRKPSCIGA